MQPGALPSVAGASVIDPECDILTKLLQTASRRPERHTFTRTCRKQSSELLLSRLPATDNTLPGSASRQSACNVSMLSWIGEGDGGGGRSGPLLDGCTQPMLDDPRAFR